MISAGRWRRGAAAILVSLTLLAASARAEEPAAAPAPAPAAEKAAPSGEGSPAVAGEQSEPAAESGAGEAGALHPADQYGGMVFDALVLRPLGVGGVIVGFAGYLLSVPLVAPGGNLPGSWELFVQGPFDYTFVRPLGDF